MCGSVYCKKLREDLKKPQSVTCWSRVAAACSRFGERLRLTAKPSRLEGPRLPLGLPEMLAPFGLPSAHLELESRLFGSSCFKMLKL